MITRAMLELILKVLFITLEELLFLLARKTSAGPNDLNKLRRGGGGRKEACCKNIASTKLKKRKERRHH